MGDSHIVPHRLSRIALLGNYLPRKCGIATFTTDTRNAIITRYPDCAVDVYAMEHGTERHDYPPEVAGVIRQEQLRDYIAAAQRINDSGADAVWLQHEYGIFGGAAGEMIVRLLDRVSAPVVVTLHTVLSHPNGDQRRVLDTILRRSSRIIVMTEKGRRLLEDVHGIDPARVAVIPHGIPDRPLIDPEAMKPRFGFEGRKVLLTFGLLSQNKGLDTVIEALPAIARRHPDVLYVILGATHPHLVAREGEAYRDGLAERAARLGVADNVRFINAFVDNGLLMDYLASADVYVTPYMNVAQITSGTLSYAMGVGKPVVSTPYWHAEEMLAGGHGSLVPVGDVNGFAEAITALLDDPAARQALGERAYARGRRMIWQQVAEDAMHALEDALLVKPLRLRPAAVPERFEPLKPNLAAIRRMTDGCGILQHGLYTVPDRDHGYCVDDNARALLLMHQLDGELAEEADALAITYASFVQHCWNGDARRFRNFMGYDRRWLEEAGSEDSCGRALWAIGATAAHARNFDLRIWASSLFDQAANMGFALHHIRSRAFTMLGAAAMQSAHPEHVVSLKILTEGGNHLRERLRHSRREGWYWFEHGLSYDNARLCEALLRAGLTLSSSVMVADGLAALEWLKDVQTAPGGHFRPVGTDSFGQGMQRPLPFDQQPLEAAAMIDACVAAHEATGDPRWVDEASRAYAWYLGGNDLELPLAIQEDGGCYDGLMPDRVNLNQGAESALSFQLACCAMMRLKAVSRGTATGRAAAE